MDPSPNLLPPSLQGLINTLTKLPVLLEHELNIYLQNTHSAVAPNSAAPATSKEEVMQIWQQVEDAKLELKLLTAAHNAKRDEMLKLEDSMLAADQQQRHLTAEAQASEIRWQRLEQDRLSFETQRAHLAEAQAEFSAREADITQRELRVASLSERFEGTRHWLENLMPGWLCEESISPWRDALMHDAQHANTSSNAAGLLFATLSLYSYAQRDTDARTVADALREVGRRLYAWIKECGHDDQLASQVAQSWADAINRECAGRCEVEVPVPGAPASNQTMNFRPRPGVSAQTVINVQFWCVRGAKREVIHRAEVTV
jgi:hypothetical protein